MGLDGVHNYTFYNKYKKAKQLYFQPTRLAVQIMTQETNVNKYQHDIRLLTTIYIMTVKNELLNKIITCVYPPMSICLAVQRITRLPLLLHCSLSNAVSDFHHGRFLVSFFCFNSYCASAPVEGR